MSDNCSRHIVARDSVADNAAERRATFTRRLFRTLDCALAVGLCAVFGCDNKREVPANPAVRSDSLDSTKSSGDAKMAITISSSSRSRPANQFRKSTLAKARTVTTAGLDRRDERDEENWR